MEGKRGLFDRTQRSLLVIAFVGFLTYGRHDDVHLSFVFFFSFSFSFFSSFFSLSFILLLLRKRPRDVSTTQKTKIGRKEKKMMKNRVENKSRLCAAAASADGQKKTTRKKKQKFIFQSTRVPQRSDSIRLVSFLSAADQFHVTCAHPPPLW